MSVFCFYDVITAEQAERQANRQEQKRNIN